MSVDVLVAAQRKLSAEDLEYVSLCNGLLDRGIKVPTEIVEHLKAVLGENVYDGYPLDVSEDTGMIEVDVEGKGDVMYRDGMVVTIANLPPGTFALRIYGVS